MKKLFFSIFFFIHLKFQNFDYEISRAKTFWQGGFHALQYVDHLKLLSEKIQGVRGFLSGKNLYFNNSFTLNFSLQIINTFGDNTGLQFIIGQEDPSPTDINLKNSKSFFKSILQKTGLNIFIFNKGLIKAQYKNFNSEKISEEKLLKCEINKDYQKLNLQFEYKDNQIEIKFSLDNIPELKNCFKFKIEKKMNNFVPYFFTKSEKEFPFRIDISAMMFQTDLQNYQIEEYSKSFSEYMPTLFLKIHNLNENSEFLETFTKNKEKMDINSIYTYNYEIFQLIELSNKEMAQIMEETEQITNFIENRQKLQAQFGDTLFKSLKTLTINSLNNYEEIDSSVDNLITEIKAYNMNKILLKVDDSFSNITFTFKKFKNTFEYFQQFNKQIKENLAYFDKQNFVKEEIKKKLQEFTNKMDEQYKQTFEGKIEFYIHFIFIGTIFLLLVIVFKMKGPVKKEVLQQIIINKLLQLIFI